MFIRLQYHWCENDGDMRFTICQHIKGVAETCASPIRAFSEADVDLIRETARKLKPQTCGDFRVHAQAGLAETLVEL